MSLKLKRRGEIWWYSGTVANRRLRGSTKTTQKSEAQRIANEIESAELAGSRDPGAVLTFAQAALEYRAHRNTVPRYLEMVEDYWKDTPVREITKGALKRAALTLQPNATGGTDFTMKEAFTGSMMKMIAPKLPDFGGDFEQFAKDLETESERRVSVPR